MKWSVVTIVLAAWWSSPSRAMRKRIAHKDDATDGEKKNLIEDMKTSPPISPMYAFLHPFMVVRAHKALKRYQGKTWIWPRLMWLSLLAVSVIFVVYYFAAGTPGATSTGGTQEEASPAEEVFFVFFGICILLPMLVLLSHFLTTVAVRMEETCVWCHIVHRSIGGSIESTLTISAYRLPFLDPSRKSPAPWQRKWWSVTNPDVTLETRKDVSRLNIKDIYDETACRVRPPIIIPPTAKRFVAKRIERQGDVVVKERKGLAPKFGSRSQTIIITVAGIIVSAIITVLVALLLPTG